MSEQSNIKKGRVLVVYVLDTTNERCNAMSFAKDSKPHSAHGSMDFAGIGAERKRYWKN